MRGLWRRVRVYVRRTAFLPRQTIYEPAQALQGMYEQEKKERAAKKNQKIITIKEVKFRINVDEHDYQTKKNHEPLRRRPRGFGYLRR